MLVSAESYAGEEETKGWPKESVNDLMEKKIVANKELARKIQQANYADPLALNWKWNVCYARILPENGWISITFDHSQVNGKDSWKIVTAHKQLIIDHNGDCEVIPNVLWTKRIDRPPFDVYIGSPTIRPRQLVRRYVELNEPHKTYIPIDLGDQLGAPALLNYTFDDKIPFNTQWEEVQRLKMNQDGYIAVDNRWKNHILPQNRWITMLRMEAPENNYMFLFDFYQYDKVELQGLSVTQNSTYSYFVFSFWADPMMKQTFIDDYNLTLFPWEQNIE